ncbi:MAG TPA: DUF58 domain-containing protein, partial [Phycisphaerales bacterium]|nr:DUF58 domain-containing protein [Phycisphaerales bacterium]
MASPASPSPGNGTQGKKRARASGSPLGTGMWAGIERARDLMLVARALAEGVHHGRHRTPDRGASTEFYDYRPYVPGDPTQLVDWRLWGRTDRFFIRRFRQDSQLTVMLVVDGSASMDFSGIDTNRVSTPTKLRRAQELAAAIAYLAVRQGDRVGLIVTGHDKRERRLVSPAPGWPALHAVINSLESLRGDGRGGNALQSAQSIGLQWHGGGSEREVEPSAETPNLAAGLRLCAAANRQRGFAIAIGDALDEPGEFFEAASRLRFGSAGSATGGAAAAAWRGSDVALLQILTDDE